MTKLRRITQPSIAILQKLADSEVICVWSFEEGLRVIPLDPESNTYILDDFDNYLSSRVNLSYSCFWPIMNQSRIITGQFGLEDELLDPEPSFFMTRPTRLRLQSFVICLDDEPGVGTPIRRNLFVTLSKFSRKNPVIYRDSVLNLSVTICKLDKFGIWIVQTWPVVKWSGFRMVVWIPDKNMFYGLKVWYLITRSDHMKTGQKTSARQRYSPHYERW